MQKGNKKNAFHQTLKIRKNSNVERIKLTTHLECS